MSNILSLNLVFILVPPTRVCFLCLISSLQIANYLKSSVILHRPVWSFWKLILAIGCLLPFSHRQRAMIMLFWNSTSYDLWIANLTQLLTFDLRFDVPMPLTVKTTDFWDVVPRNLLTINNYFGGTCFFCLQCRRLIQAEWAHSFLSVTTT
jgi:hypothetical protein